MWNQNEALHRVIRYFRAVTFAMHKYKKNKLKFAIRITLASTSTVIKVAKYCNTMYKKLVFIEYL